MKIGIAAANIRGGRGKTRTKEKIGANCTLHYGSNANTATQQTKVSIDKALLKLLATTLSKYLVGFQYEKKIFKHGKQKKSHHSGARMEK